MTTQKDAIYDAEYLEQVEKIQSICDLYSLTVGLINKYFVLDKVRLNKDTFIENNKVYLMFKMPYQPKGLIDSRKLIQTLPDFKEQDLAAATISLEQHLQIYSVLLQSLIKSKILLTDLKKNKDKEVNQIEDNIKDLVKQLKQVDQQLLLDCQELQKKAPEDIIFAYAISDLNDVDGLDKETIENMKALVKENHQTIQNAQAMIEKANRVNEVLHESQQALSKARKEEMKNDKRN